jgi:hypothetical protein
LTVVCGGAGEGVVESADPAPAPHPAEVPEETSLSKAEVLAKVKRAYAPGLKRCYQRTLKLHPAAAGRIEVALIVDGHGQGGGEVTGVDPDLDQCVAALLKTWRFTSPTRDGAPAEARFTLPYVFAS